MKILIMGLPGSGKTTLAEKIKKELTKQRISVEWYNADDIRKRFDDWDFSNEGRIRQAHRMALYAGLSDSDFSICDFVAPTEILRNIFNADYTIWMNTIAAGRFDDTNKIFEKPMHYNMEISSFDYDISNIITLILNNKN